MTQTSTPRRTSAADIGPDEFRRLGHALVDRVAALLEGLPGRPVSPGSSPAAVRAALGATDDLPEQGRAASALLDAAVDLLGAHSTFNGHPRFFGYITSSASPLGALAELLAAAVNPNVGAWALAPAASEIEAQTIRWLAQFLKLPGRWDGLFVSGGNMANLVGFWAARTAKGHADLRADGVRPPGAKPLVLYTSEETHTWIRKAADLSGLGTAAVRWIGTDDALRLRVDLLESQIQRDRAEGMQPFLLCGTAGSVSTGAVDPLGAMADVARRHGLWFHVDGAYGAPAAAVDAEPELRHLGRADSIAVDPHKWLYAPIEAGCTLVRDPAVLRNAFAFSVPYYRFDSPDGEPSHEYHNYHELGPQNTRGFRALKVWLGFQHVGAAGYRTMIGDDLALAAHLHALVSRTPELEPVSHGLSITTFRYVPPDLRAAAMADAPHGALDATDEYLSALNERVLADVVAGGEAFLSNAVVRGRFVLRACVVNFRTQREDVDALVAIVVRAGRAADAELRPTHETAPGPTGAR